MVPYSKIPKIVHAIQVVYANCEKLVDLGNEYSDRLEIVTDSDCIVTKVIVRNNVTYMVAKPTDWIVKDGDNFAVLSDEVFKKTYQVAE